MGIDRFRSVLAGCGLRKTRSSGHSAAMLPRIRWSGNRVTNQDAKTLLERACRKAAKFKQRYQLAVVSDAQTAYALPELQAVGLREFFDPIIISGDFGYRKPDSRLFLHALEKLRVTSSQAIFVGNDTYRDVF